MTHRVSNQGDYYFFALMPIELKSHILSFLPINKLLPVRTLNKEWKQLAQDDFLWEIYFTKQAIISSFFDHFLYAAQLRNLFEKESALGDPFEEVPPLLFHHKKIYLMAQTYYENAVKLEKNGQEIAKIDNFINVLINRIKIDGPVHIEHRFPTAYVKSHTCLHIQCNYIFLIHKNTEKNSSFHIFDCKNQKEVIKKTATEGNIQLYPFERQKMAIIIFFPLSPKKQHQIEGYRIAENDKIRRRWKLTYDSDPVFSSVLEITEDRILLIIRRKKNNDTNTSLLEINPRTGAKRYLFNLGTKNHVSGKRMFFLHHPKIGDFMISDPYFKDRSVTIFNLETNKEIFSYNRLKASTRLPPSSQKLAALLNKYYISRARIDHDDLVIEFDPYISNALSQGSIRLYRKWRLPPLPSPSF